MKLVCKLCNKEVPLLVGRLGHLKARHPEKYDPKHPEKTDEYFEITQ